MEGWAKRLSTINLPCLRLDDTAEEARRIERSQAAFLDTIAAVEYALASEEERPSEKRAKLCSAQRHAQRALSVAAVLADDRQRTRDLDAEAKDWELSKAWEDDQKRLEAIEAWALFSRRLDQIKASLKNANIDCTI
jgi:hypothetical protein